MVAATRGGSKAQVKPEEEVTQKESIDGRGNQRKKLPLHHRGGCTIEAAAHGCINLKTKRTRDAHLHLHIYVSVSLTPEAKQAIH
jgi:hypothetical protein